MQQSKQKDDKALSKSLEKLNGTNKKEDGDNTPKESSRDKSNKYRMDVKAPSPSFETKSTSSADAKKADKYEKDGSDRKHKHKKKEKSKDKDKERKKDKEKSSKAAVKEHSEESSLSTSSNQKPTNAHTPPTRDDSHSSNAKINSMQATSHSYSDKSSSEYDDDDYHRPPSPPMPHLKSDKFDAVEPMQTDQLIAPILDLMPPRSNQSQSESPVKSKATDKSSNKKSKEPKSQQSTPSSKDEKKAKKRKSKAEKQKDDNVASNKRKTQSPASSEDPPAKLSRKEESLKADSKSLPSRTPPITHLPDMSSMQKPHALAQQQHFQSNTITSTTSVANMSDSSSSSSSSSESMSPEPSSANASDYMSQLRALQQKIMTLQDNNYLQQVVEMIAATGCYEVTSRTFDFDLCALDRRTVQRLQDFFSQSVL